MKPRQTAIALHGAAAIALFLSGCFQTLDIRRPLAPQPIPPATTLVPLYQPQVEEKTMQRSLDRTARAVKSYSVKKYNDNTAFVATAALGDALATVAANPYAWIQLGAQLTLDHQSEAAIRATEQGLSIIDRLCRDNCPRELEQLRTVGNVNLGMILASADRPAEALFALNQVSSELLNGVDKLAYYWTMTHVNTQLGELEEATAHLTAAAEVVPNGASATSHDFIYKPHYVGAVRRANEHFLQALICVSARDLDCANAEIDLSLKAHEASWEAQLLRANLHYDTCDFDSAITSLRRLGKEAPKNMVFHAERIPFNLGNAYFARHRNAATGGSLQDLHDAVAAFEESANIVAHRVTKARNRADSARVMSKPAAVSSFFMRALTEIPPVYADALNNVGEVEFRLASLRPDVAGRRTHYAKAERHWREALRDHRWPRRGLAWANLTHLYCAIGQPRSALAAAEESLEEDPYNIASLEALALFAARTPDLELSAKLSEAVARLLWVRRERYEPGSFEELLRPTLERLRARPESAAGGRAIVLTELVLAPSEEWRQMLRTARVQYPQWRWVAIQEDLLTDSEDISEEGKNAAEALLASAHVPGDWWQRLERADAHALRARTAYRSGDSAEARESLERAVAHGADISSMRDLRVAVEAGELPWSPKSLVAVLPLDGVYRDRSSSFWPHALAFSVSDALMSAGITSRYIGMETAGADHEAQFTPAEAGRRVAAGAVLSGRMAATTGKVVVDLLLTDPISGSEIAIGPLEEAPENIHALTATILTRVTEALKVPTDGTRVMNTAMTAHPKAYRAYLDGLQTYFEESSAHKTVIGSYEAAIEEDPQFARALTELARAYILKPYRVSPRVNDARQSLESALAIDEARGNATGQTHYLRAMLAAWVEWNFEEADAAFRRAVQLDPKNAALRRGYASFLRTRGRFEDALSTSIEASELAPFSPTSSVAVAWPLLYLGRLDHAAEQAREALRLRPDMEEAHQVLAWVHTFRGNYDAALNEIATVPEKQRSGALVAHEAVTLARRGDATAAAALLDKIDRRRPLYRARVLVALGRLDAARAELKKALKDRSSYIPYLEFDPWLEPLRADGTIAKLVARIEPR